MLGDSTGNTVLERYFIDGMKFTTYDRDNDNEGSANCAADFGFGWWYNDCNCPYLDLYIFCSSLKEMVMLIRPK
ncbi:ficolin-2-like [Drosophila nasuta]|uniref:ficolin-2-like n=1 Tax=Drosophila nasuta TaxID=42062 RepID=UPI00295F34B3|nr:ficolin-2-like [Drosophila nasuta]